MANVTQWIAGLAVVTVASGDAYVEAREAVRCDELAGCNQQGESHQKPIVTVAASVGSTTHIAMTGPFYFPNTIGEGEYEIVAPLPPQPTITLFRST
jgi:hypothetical protein